MALLPPSSLQTTCKLEPIIFPAFLALHPPSSLLLGKLEPIAVKKLETLFKAHAETFTCNLVTEGFYFSEQSFGPPVYTVRKLELTTYLT